VGARQPDGISKKMHQQQPWLDFTAMLDAIDPNRNLFFPCRVHLLRPYLNGTSAIKFLSVASPWQVSDTSMPWT
jgi:hypothetical protein